MVDAINLIFMESAHQCVVQFFGRLQIVAKWFFHDNPQLNFLFRRRNQPGVKKPLNCVVEQRRRSYLVDHPWIPGRGSMQQLKFGCGISRILILRMIYQVDLIYNGGVVQNDFSPVLSLRPLC